MNWYWLSPSRHPDRQRSGTTCADRAPSGQAAFTVAEFAGVATFDTAPASVRIRASADATFFLFLNGRPLWTGPAAVGNDFLPFPSYPGAYADEASFDLDGDTAEFLFSVLVRANPLRGTEYSSTHNGFALEAEFRFPDGSSRRIVPDASWRGRLRFDFVDPGHYNGRLEPGAWEPLAPVADVWHAATAPIPVCALVPVAPLAHASVTVPDGALFTFDAPFERIHMGFLEVSSNTPCRISAELYEKDAGHVHAWEEMILDPGAGRGVYRSIAPQSIGGVRFTVHNLAPDLPATVRIGLLDTHYPVTAEGSFHCSDSGLDKVFDVCAWTLRICRQSMHLDSPKHQEPLACTGDYAIEALMTAFAFGDMRLAALDVRRTARILELNDGRMFHTTYSLIWVLMLRDVHDFTGDDALLRDSLPALEAFLKRFRTYLGANGLVDAPPDYMFVDWLVVDGYSMHHPPKALGQTVLNAFTHGALLAAADIFDRLGDAPRATALRAEADSLRAACNALLYDADLGFYIDGLGDTDPGCAPWRPANPEGLRHVSRHSNILAALFGLQTGDAAATLLRRTLESDLPDVQPYFMHYVLEALDKCGLFAEFGLPILRRWIPLAEECPKGLKEGWYAPEEGYAFDYSHAWGGTPAYQLPARLLGFRMVEPGFRRIALAPRLHGLDWADIAMPTPFGLLRCHMEKGAAPVLDIPDGLHVELS